MNKQRVNLLAAAAKAIRFTLGLLLCRALVFVSDGNAVDVGVAGIAVRQAVAPANWQVEIETAYIFTRETDAGLTVLSARSDRKNTGMSRDTIIAGVASREYARHILIRLSVYISRPNQTS